MEGRRLTEGSAFGTLVRFSLPFLLANILQACYGASDLFMVGRFSDSVGVCAVVAFSGATHDIAADGVYMSELSTEDQARYIGWQGAFYNLAKLVATGGLVWFAGWLSKRFSDSGAATFDAYVQSWTVVLAILCGLLVLLGLIGRVVEVSPVVQGLGLGRLVGLHLGLPCAVGVGFQALQPLQLLF